MRTGVRTCVGRGWQVMRGDVSLEKLDQMTCSNDATEWLEQLRRMNDVVGSVVSAICPNGVSIRFYLIS